MENTLTLGIDFLIIILGIWFKFFWYYPEYYIAFLSLKDVLAIF